MQFNEFFKTIGSNLKYGSLELIREYQDILSKERLNKAFRGYYGGVYIEKIKFCEVFLTDYINLSKEIGIYSPTIKEPVEGALLFTKLKPLIKKIDEDFSSPFLSDYPRFYKLISNIQKKRNFIKRVANLDQKYSRLKNRKDHKFTYIVNYYLDNKAYKLLKDISSSFVDLKKPRYFFENGDKSLYASWETNVNSLLPFYVYKDMLASIKNYKRVK
ncbi:hypothetical protein [Bacillus atrophaeus]|nr:hypothetical protein [Bacillus atrophaeus]MDL5143643.1 hypothetical protein [Bacillus atrophaeus]